MSGFGTDCIHAGQNPDPNTGAVIIPISLSTTFVQKSPGINQGFEYSRSGNPTRNALEDCIAATEKGKFGLCFSSGLGCTATIFSMLKPEDELICADDVYGGTRRYFSKVGSPSTNVVIKYVDFNIENALESAITDKTKMVWIETPTNPTLKIFDIRKIVDKCKEKSKDIIIVVDNTFMSPYNQQPLNFGADIVMHSISKYINGHSDVIMGVAVINCPTIHERLRYLQNALGAVPSPFDCFMVLRGIKTLHVRMQRHNENALVVASFLESHPKVEKVIYPGLKSHPQYEIGKKQMSGSGGMITFFLKGGLTESKSFLENLKLIALAESLGGVESLIEHPAIMTHASVPPEVRKELGISDNLIRLSVGIEDLQDILADLKRGFDSF